MIQRIKQKQQKPATGHLNLDPSKVLSAFSFLIFSVIKKFLSNSEGFWACGIS